MRQESADLAIIPTGEDATSIVHELNAVAFKAWHLDTEKLLTAGSIPDTDVVNGAGSEQIRVTGGESDVVDLLVVASVTELGCDGVGVAPVDGSLGGATEEMGRVGRGRDRGARSLDLLLSLQFHHLVADLELGNSAVSSTDEKVTVSQERHAVDAELEECASWSDSLEESAIEVDLDDVTSDSAQESTSVVRGDCDTLESSLDLAHLEVLVEDLLLDVVDVPDADAIVVNGHEVVGRVVVEADLVGYMHAD